jgi:transcriptional regulator with XRE-family HTH domain
MNIGEAIKGARKQAKLTQVQLAKELKVSQTTITHWEHGTNVPNVATLQEISKLTKTTFSELFGLGELHPVFARYNAKKGLYRASNSFIQWDFNFGIDTLLVGIDVNVRERLAGDVVVFEAASIRPADMRPDILHLLEGFDGTILGGMPEPHPTKQGYYRVINHNIRSMTGYIKVRAAHRSVALIYGQGEQRKYITKRK